MPRVRRVLACLLGGCLAAIVAGCGSSKPTDISRPDSKESPTFGIPIAPPGNSSVTGKVTLDGEAIGTGRVLFFTEAGLCMSVGVIEEGGKYTCENLPDGPAEAIVLLDPDGELPFPTNLPGIPGGGPPGMPAPPVGGPPVMPPGMPPGGPQMGPQPLPAPFLQQLKFTVPQDQAAKFKQAHKKYAKASGNNPLKVTVAGATTFDIKMTR